MIHNKFRYLLTLVALFAMTAGAWADDLSESFTTNTGASVYTGQHFKITPHAQGVGDSDGFIIHYDFPATIEALNGEIITKVEFTVKEYVEDLRSDDGTVTYNGNVATVSNVNATSMTVVAEGYIYIRAVKVYYTAGPEVTWNAATKTGTFEMPGGDVVLTPLYAPTATWATTGSGSEVKTLLPEAAEGVIAGTTAPLIIEGTVANAGTTENPQGLVMYYAAKGTADAAPTAPTLESQWSADVPTAEAYINDEDGATVYVWYYIAGANTPDGEDPTADNTFNDSEICATPLKVSVLSNKFDIALKAANANTIDATQASKGTVSVKVGTAAVDKTSAITDEGKLQGVKMGSEVKMTAKQGYKFRKVEVKKTKTKLTIGDITLDVTGCSTWQQVADKNSTLISIFNNMVCNASTSKNLKKGDSYVRPDDPVDPTATDYQFVEGHS